MQENLLSRVSSETSSVSYFAKYETKQVLCFAKFRYEAKQAASRVSLFFKRNRKRELYAT
jgi:hypothetical protein